MKRAPHTLFLSQCHCDIQSVVNQRENVACEVCCSLSFLTKWGTGPTDPAWEAEPQVKSEPNTSSEDMKRRVNQRACDKERDSDVLVGDRPSQAPDPK